MTRIHTTPRHPVRHGLRLATIATAGVSALLLGACGTGHSAGHTAPEPTATDAEPAALWACSWWDDTITEIDPATGEVVATASVYAPTQVSIGSSGVWSEGTRVDPLTDRAEVVTDDGPDVVAAADDGAWFGYADTARRRALRTTVVHYDAATGKLDPPVHLGITGDFAPIAMKWSDDALYGLSWNGQLFRVDTETDAVTLGDPGLGDVWPTDLAVDGTSLWVIDPFGVYQVSTTDLGYTGKFPTSGVTPVAVDVDSEGTPWVVTSDSTLARLDPATGRLESSLPLPKGATDAVDLEIVDGAAWVRRDNQLVRVDLSNGEVTTTLQLGKKKDTPYCLAST